MTSSATVLTSALVSATLSLGIGIYIGTRSSEEPTAIHAGTVAPGEIDALRREQAELRETLSALASRPQSQGQRVSPAAIEEIVARYLDDRGALSTTLAVTDEPASKIAVRSAPVEDLLAALLGAEGMVAREEVWAEIRESGRLDEVLAAFEARAEANPNDPDVQVELGDAYIAKIQEVGNGPMAGVFATKADEAFDRALEVEPGHWDARFTKGVALSFWPPVFGKKNEAIAQFEQLVTQQAGLSPQPEHAQVHLLLGNLYQELGATEQAIAAWKSGLSIFPGDEALAAQIQWVQGQ